MPYFGMGPRGRPPGSLGSSRGESRASSGDGGPRSGKAATDSSEELPRNGGHRPSRDLDSWRRRNTSSAIRRFSLCRKRRRVESGRGGAREPGGGTGTDLWEELVLEPGGDDGVDELRVPGPQVLAEPVLRLLAEGFVVVGRAPSLGRPPLRLPRPETPVLLHHLVPGRLVLRFHAFLDVP